MACELPPHFTGLVLIEGRMWTDYIEVRVKPKTIEQRARRQGKDATDVAKNKPSKKYTKPEIKQKQSRPAGVALSSS